MTAANEALSTDTPATVTFDTLSAAQELRKTGLEDRQAEAVVTTISKAMSETVATKADLELQSAAAKADLELLKSDFDLLRSEFESLRQHVDSRFEKVDLRFDTLEKSLRQEMAAQENRIIIKLGGLMVTMTFLLLAIGPFYIRWVLSLMGSS
jgi:5-methylthioribose kinase